MDENTAKEIAKENMWKTLQKMVTESDMKSLSTEDQIFTRKLKIFSTGVEKDLPEHYPDDLVEVNLSMLAKLLGINRDKLRVRIVGFDSQKRISTVSDDPVIIAKIRAFFELNENSSQVHSVEVYIFGRLF